MPGTWYSIESALPLISKPSGASSGSSSGAWLPSPYGASSVEADSSTSSTSALDAGVSSAAGASSAAEPAAAACCDAATRRARSASDVTVFCATSSITAMGALSPLRGSVFVMRV